MINTKIAAAGCIALLLCATVPGFAALQDRVWNFRVLLDGAEIGYHRYQISARDGNSMRVTSDADFKVRFLFFTAYRYEHSNVEVWQGECLSSVESQTVTNGKRTVLEGSRGEDSFVVEVNGSRETLPSCMMSFAYWNPAFLEQEKLLNPQTGEYLDVRIERADEQQLVVGGNEVLATRYRVVAKDIVLDLWYSQDRQWLALESIAKGGRIIRYELT